MNWIDIEDRLPEVGQRVLVVAYGWESETVYLGRFEPGCIKGDPEGKRNFWGNPIKPCDWRLAGWSYFRHPDVRYWMPCPEPPEKGGE